MFDHNYSKPHDTRLSQKNLVRLKDTRVPNSELASRSFKWRATQQYNTLPVEIRKIDEVEKFKQVVKEWIVKNVSIN